MQRKIGIYAIALTIGMGVVLMFSQTANANAPAEGGTCTLKVGENCKCQKYVNSAGETIDYKCGQSGGESCVCP